MSLILDLSSNVIRRAAGHCAPLTSVRRANYVRQAEQSPSDLSRHAAQPRDGAQAAASVRSGDTGQSPDVLLCRRAADETGATWLVLPRARQFCGCR